ncbi:MULTISPECIES: hypothetical protein [unclassified Glutamicibacter]|uniref:hypothetical protein n=1 Tax=unclassified Glutamicibacter TaxID=2627139 RepID=UPI003800971E
MSNYLIAVGVKSKIDKIRSSLMSNESINRKYSSEVAEQDLSNGYKILIVSRGAESETDFKNKVFFRGYAIFNETERKVIFSGNSSSSSVVDKRSLSFKSVEGCYVSCAWNQESNKVEISNDLFSLCPLFRTVASDVALFSDSIYVLRESRRILSMPITVDVTSVTARTWANAMAGQMLSSNTMIDQIKMVPVGSTMRVELGKRLVAHLQSGNLPEIFGADAGPSYEQSLREYTVEYVSLLSSLASLGPARVNMAVSGGLDSRVNIASVTLSEELKSQAKITCQNSAPQHQKDFEVVAELAEIHELPLNRQMPNAATRKIERVENPLGLWYLSSSGLYDFMVLPDRIVTEHPTFNIGGHGAELAKGQYGWRSMSQIHRTIKNKNVADAFYAETEVAMLEMGIDFDDPIASEWHYLGHRNALHSGRFVTTSMIGVRPFMNRKLVGLARSESWKGTVRSGKSLGVIHDIISLISPQMASHRYDDDRKNISSPEVDARLSTLCGRIHPDEIYKFEIEGSADEVVNGYSFVLAELARKRGHMLHKDRETLSELTRTGFEIAQTHGLGDVCQPILEEANSKLADLSLPLQFARSSIGKLLSYHLLD